MRRVLKFLLGLALCTLVFIGILTTQPFVAQAQAITNPDVSTDALKQHVKYLSVDVYPRSYDFPKNLELAANYIQSTLAAAGMQVEEQKFEVKGQAFRNLIVRFGPVEGKTLVFGAHYDSHGNHARGAALSAQGFSTQSHTPGADDNASGVAGLIELAKLLHANPPTQPVELVFYTLEEPPNFRTENMGSAWHARSMHEQYRAVDMMVAVEMIGYFTDEADSQAYPLAALKLIYPNTGNFIAVVGRYADMAQVRRVKSALNDGDLPVRSINAPASIKGIDFSDHLNYWALGDKAVMVTDTSFYRNREYHLGGDTYERLSYPRMAQVVQGLYRLAMQP